MLRLNWLTAAALLASLAVLAGRAMAENEGQEDLDKAAEAKIAARTLTDLSKVIQLAESALEKGLDDDNKQFAENLLAATLIQRGTAISGAIFKTVPPDARWPQFRHVALSDLEKAVKLSPAQPNALLLIARLNMLPGGERKRAAEAVDAAVKLLDDDAEKRAKALLLRATLEKDPEKRLADLDKAAELRPDDAAAHEARGLVLAEMEKFDEALAALAKASELAPESPLPLVHKARIYVRQKDLQAALADLNKAHEIDPDNAAVLLLRAGLYDELDEAEKALADVDRLLAMRPDLPVAMRLRAVLLGQLDRFEDAVAELEKLVLRQPSDKLVLLQLGMFYNAQKQYAKAIETYSTLLADDADDWRALRGRGDALLNTGKQAEAVADYEKALKQEPEDSGLLNNLAWVLATSPNDELRDGARAIEVATKACELTEHKQAHVLSTLAAAHAETGDFAAAIKWVEKGLELADDKTREPLQNELKSYRAKKPFRELLGDDEENGDESEGKEPDKDEDKEPVPKEDDGSQPEPDSEPEVIL